MKRIVLCFDGTWNVLNEDGRETNGKQPSNVSRFHFSVSPAGDDGIQQVSYPFDGVGTGRWDRYTGGILGAGLTEHLRAGYEKLVEVYEDGDEIYILGFSRGAYTARSLAGMINNCGLVRRSLGGASTTAAYLLYRTRSDGPDSQRARRFRSWFSREIPIKFLGVWDTVGALGIPLNVADRLNKTLYEFHDTKLSSIVERAYHAVAIDEQRPDFTATLWDNGPKSGQTLEQRWFAGAHSDVGGGCPDPRLSDITLRWMQDRAAEAGLALRKVEVGEENYKGNVTDSYGDFLAKASFLRGLIGEIKPRSLRRISATQGNETIDPSVRLRRIDGSLGYAPMNQILPPIP